MDSSEQLEVEYLEPVDVGAEPLPSAFSVASLRRSLAVLAVIVAVVVALIVLLPGLGSLRERFDGARWEWLVVAPVLQLGSALSYVVAFRRVFCRRMAWQTSAEIGFSELGANSL